MILNFIGGLGPLGGAVLVLVFGIGVLALIVLSGGMPDDVKGKISWQTWAIAGIAILAVLFLLGRSMNKITYHSCYESGQVSC